MTTPWQPPGPSAQPTTPTGGEEPRARPQYGEYAPPGYVSPVAPQQPEPPVSTPPAVPNQPPVYYATPPVVRTVKTADIVVTCILLFLGLIGVLFGIGAPALFPAALADDYLKYGLHYTQPAGLGTITTVIWISHLVLYLIALGGSIPLMAKRRVAFWVPLTTGIIAAVIFWGLLIAVAASDPAFVNAVQAGT